MAALIALITLSIFSLIALYLVFTSATSVRISDNYESEVQASYAAKAGLNHTRDILEGLNFNDLLKGPDGTYDSGASYMAQARTFSFRNLMSWATARSLNVLDPTSDLSAIPDDGLVNTGKLGGTNGTVLIPLTGIAQTASNPYGSGTITTSRYFVKVSDNNGEATELAGDASDNPFFDGDSVIIVRSIGVAQTVREFVAGTIRRNSVAVVESRFRRRQTFALDAPLVVQGDSIAPSASNMFNGNSFSLDGGGSNYGIATIDTNTSNGTTPTSSVMSNLDPNQYDNITGNGIEPSVSDITGTVGADQDKSLLLSQEYLYNFAFNVVPAFADAVYQGDQSWSGGSAPDMGFMDGTLPYNDPSQRPKTIFVNGDLNVSGDISGGGILVVTGKLSGSGHFHYDGIILVIGEGDCDLSGLNYGIYGGLYVVNVQNVGGVISFGTPKLTVSGNSEITMNSANIMMGINMLPAAQLSWREIHSDTDP